VVEYLNPRDVPAGLSTASWKPSITAATPAMRHLGSEVLELFDQRSSHVSYEDQALLMVDSDGWKVARLVRGE
jgi:hypothetical protein